MDHSLYEALLSDCSLCPRKCHVNRLTGETGYCGQTSQITAARAALHMWEEPCISGTCGSGAVFFSGCNMGCVFCQNYSIAHSAVQMPVSSGRLSDIFLELQEQKACNINLVTPTHFVPQIAEAIETARNHGLVIPVVYNTSGYEEVSTLRLLDGLVDIYLPDCKYCSSALSLRYSNAPDYFEVCGQAIREMIRQTGAPLFYPPSVHPAAFLSTDSDRLMCAASYNDYVETLSASDTVEESEDYSGPLMKKGVIVRHLVLPGQTADSRNVIRYLCETFGKDIYISIMNQYTPMPHSAEYPELTQKVTAKEYDALIDDALDFGLENGFIQGADTAAESFIPAFDFAGLRAKPDR